MTDPLARLSAAGVAIWLDDLSRERLDSDDTPKSIATLSRTRHVVGITSNPTIFAAALAPDSPGAHSYTETLAQLRRSGASVEEAVRELTTSDVRLACDKLRHIYDHTDRLDGRVSIEVDPRLAHDTDATVAEAATLWKTVDRPNLFIKIPATSAGLPAITRTLAAGISVNVTLIFSLRRYDEVMDAFLDGIEQARDHGHDVSNIASVASFFVSRVDTEVDRRLDALVDAAEHPRNMSENLIAGEMNTSAAQQLRGTAAIANARLAYQRYQHVFTSSRWLELAAAGARPQRPLWASTGVKDPAYSDTRYVTELVAPGTVNTMPEATLLAFADHGELRDDVVTSGYTDAAKTLAELATLGIDYDDVVTTLEREGVDKFAASWQQLSESVAQQLGEQ